jgi:dipeptidyl aminopeptidase/acylaminoacyl peptidase
MTRVLNVAVVITFVGAVLGAQPASATFPGENGRIVFDGEDGYIRSMRPDGSDVRRLAAGIQPVYSPDGRRIAFARFTVASGFDIWVMSANGSNKTQVTTHVAWENEPMWSADGRFLYFLSDRSGRDDIFRVRSTVPYGKAQSIVRARSMDEPTNCSGEWAVARASIHDITMSPLGDYLAFGMSSELRETACQFDPMYRWIRADLDGTDLLFLDNEVRCPNWGPGGTSLAGVRALPTSQPGDPGQLITFRSDQEGEKVVFTETADGDCFSIGCPAWSPKGGRHLIFARDVWEFVGEEQDTALVLTGIFRTLSNGTGPVVQISGRRASNIDWQPVR